MIKSIRLRHPQKPFITQELIYNHYEEPVDTNSQASFLKLSETTSHLKKPQEDYELFAKMQYSINKLQKKHSQKLVQIQNKLKIINSTGKKQMVQFTAGRELIQQNKQNLKMTYRKFYDLNEEVAYPLEYNNFQIDNNLNYIKSSINQSSKLESPIYIEPLDTKQLLSQELQDQKLSTCKNNSSINQMNSNYKHLRMSSQIKRSCDQNNKKPKQITRSQTRRNSVDMKSRSNSLNLEEPTTKRKTERVYEQILSLYSTAKLLAMEKKNK